MYYVEFKCPNCGSYNTDLVDKSFSDNGVRLDCESCGHREYRKDSSDFESREIKVTNNKHVERIGFKRNRASRRHNNIVKAIRKRNISDAVYYHKVGHHYYNNLHQFSKNKIHCSCSLCARKTNSVWGKHPKISDIRAMQSMKDDCIQNCI